MRHYDVHGRIGPPRQGGPTSEDLQSTLFPVDSASNQAAGNNWSDLANLAITVSANQVKPTVTLLEG